jgi:predicted MPP superfamily phosphohydrolase
MNCHLRFAIVSDLHICLPHTLWDHPQRFHLVEVSIPALEAALADLAREPLDFLLLPGDLTQHGEPDNHAWLAERLKQLPYPVYVIPGNHDVPVVEADQQSIGWQDFPQFYRDLGYGATDRLYYTCLLQPGVRLVALNSNQFDPQGQQYGAVDAAQMQWLKVVLEQAQADHELVLVMIHHNVIEHFPGQSHQPFGQRYLLQEAGQLCKVLRSHGVQLVFTGHLHIQDLAYDQGLYDVTTGSLVSYPHPYRLVEIQGDLSIGLTVGITSRRVDVLADWPDLQTHSKEWMGDRGVVVLDRLLAQPPLELPASLRAKILPHLRYFWSTVAAGDPYLRFPDLPSPVREYFERFSSDRQRHWAHLGSCDNQAQLRLNSNCSHPGQTVLKPTEDFPANRL